MSALGDLGESPYHVALVVPDVRAATADLSARFGWSWTPIRRRQQCFRQMASREIRETEVDVCFSKHAPFRLEVISGVPGTPWDITGHLSFHHLAWWVDDLATAVTELVERGATLEAQGVDPETGREPARFAYLHTAGLRVELQEAARKPDFESWFDETGTGPDQSMLLQ